MPLSIKRLRGAQPNFDFRQGLQRKEISLPVSLLSTTNMLSYEAPDLPTARHMMATRTSSDTDNSSSESPISLPALTPDGGSPGSSPAVEYNHLSAYFPGPTVKRTASARLAQAADADVPSIPQRVPSHSKREHERLARKRSLRSVGKQSPSAPSSPVMATFDQDAQRTSVEIMGVSAPEPAPAPKPAAAPKQRSPQLGSNPFSPELEQLSEVNEESGITGDVPEDEDTQYMRQHGLLRFAAADYRNVVGHCYPKSPFDFGFTPIENAMGWI